MPLIQKDIEKYIKKPIAVHVYRTIDSTNDEAKRRLHTDSGVTVYAADHQTSGRGRRGHSFYSPQDTGLYFTLSYPVKAYSAGVQLTTCAAGVAVCEAVASLNGKHPQIKWVNDIFLGGRKAAGILTELCTDENNRPVKVLIGVGINLTTDRFPDEIASTAGCIGALDPNRLCAEICSRLLEHMKSLCYDSGNESNNAVNSMIEKYTALNLCIGKQIRYTDQTGAHTAQAVGIAPDGSLIVSENGEKKSLRSGEISILL